MRKNQKTVRYISCKRHFHRPYPVKHYRERQHMKNKTLPFSFQCLGITNLK